MDNPAQPSPPDADLRRRAEARLLGKGGSGTAGPAQVHELQVHQVELELQLEALAELNEEMARERVAVEGRYATLQRIHLAVSETARAVLEGLDEKPLLQRICDIAHQYGDFMLAWIGLEDPAAGGWRITASSGSALDYLEGIGISADPGSPTGQGPFGISLRQGRPAVIDDFRTDPRAQPWLDRAARCGIVSCASLPIRRSGRAVGALMVYSDRAGFFGQDSLTLLERITEGLSYALDALDREAARRQAEATVQQLNESLEERIRQRTALLEQANAELDAFSYSVSHDLRAPLRGIDGFSLALLEDCGGQLGEAGNHYLRRIRAGTQRMGLLIDDLLKLSRMSRSALNREPLDLSAMARTLLDEIRARDPERRVDAAVEPGLHASGDPGLVRSVLENLLGNAWKYSARVAGARIELFREAQPDGAQAFCVRDNGAGFDMAYAGKLFTAFQRLHTQQDFEGSGIGLAIVQRIVHRHGGRAWATGAVGQGACFRFTLPERP